MLKEAYTNWEFSSTSDNALEVRVHVIIPIIHGVRTFDGRSLSL